MVWNFANASMSSFTETPNNQNKYQMRMKLQSVDYACYRTGISDGIAATTASSAHQDVGLISDE